MSTNEIKARVAEYQEAGKSIGFIREMIRDEFSLSHAEYKKMAESLGISQGGSGEGDVSILVKVLRENHNKIPRGELVKLMAEKSGYKESTANHMLSQLNFAKEYARQVNGGK
jgi:hypothetical protein